MGCYAAINQKYLLKILYCQKLIWILNCILNIFKRNNTFTVYGFKSTLELYDLKKIIYYIKLT